MGQARAESHGRVAGELRLGRRVGALREDQDAAACRLRRTRESTEVHLRPQVLVDRVQPEHEDADPGKRSGAVFPQQPIELVVVWEEEAEPPYAGP